MTEPVSMLSIARFSAERILLVGDPLQLPPTLSSSAKQGVNGLERTLFERLSENSIDPILLRTQYRVCIWCDKEVHSKVSSSNCRNLEFTLLQSRIKSWYFSG